jgi:hypothetical protein
MPKMEECLIHIDLANALIDEMKPKPDKALIELYCPACHKAVKATRDGFEHVATNP